MQILGLLGVLSERAKKRGGTGISQVVARLVLPNGVVAACRIRSQRTCTFEVPGLQVLMPQALVPAETQRQDGTGLRHWPLPAREFPTSS